MKKSVLFCMGLSGSGKSYFIQHYLQNNGFYKLKSATTRPMRPGEQNGREYYFVSAQQFEDLDLVTNLWVNQNFWTPGKPKWMYGVPTFEVFTHQNTNLVYDVIQPRYARQMIDWFNAHRLGREYDFKTIYFIAPNNNFDMAAKRTNMPDDIQVRQQNTCDPIDFLRSGLDIDFLIRSSASETILSPKLRNFLRAHGISVPEHQR